VIQRGRRKIALIADGGAVGCKVEKSVPSRASLTRHDSACRAATASLVPSMLAIIGDMGAGRAGIAQPCSPHAPRSN
jgi:hypothetical protein